MYFEIEEEFKKQSLLRRSQIAICLTCFLPAFLFTVCFWHFVDRWFFLCILSYAVIFYTGAYVFIIFKLCRFKKFSWKRILSFRANVNAYKAKVHDNDIALLKNILKNHKINTRPKQLEAIRHYQAWMPRNIVAGESLLTVIVFAISMISLVLDDKIYYNAEIMKLVFIIIVMVVLFYRLLCDLNKNIFQLFGDLELYKRLECSISEIYMDNQS